MPAVALPCNVEAERSVLGAMLCDPSAAEVGVESLEETDFSESDKRNRYIFRAMKALHERHSPIDPQMVNGQLVNMHLDDLAGGLAYLLELVDAVINPDNIDLYIEMVHEQSVLRQLLLKTAEIQEEYAKGVRNIGDFISASNDAITLISQKRSVQGMKKASEVAHSVQSEIRKKAESKDEKGITGLETGYRVLNEFTHGWQNGDLIILAARPSVGKTAFGMNLAYLAAHRSKVPVGFFSLEMSADRVMERLIACRSCVANDKIQTGSFLTQKELAKIKSAIDEISETELYFDDTPNCKLGELVSKATKLKKQHPDLGLIVIDYLGRIRYSDKVDMANHQQEVGLISGALKSLARQLNVPVLCLAQLNRSVETNDDKRPTLANLRDSGSIEQDADICMLMYREDYYTSQGISVKNKYQRRAEGQAAQAQPQEESQENAGKKAGDTSKTTIIVAKNRNGKTGSFELMFQRNFSRFTEPTSDYQERQAEMYRAAEADFSDFEG
ncbi:MAG: replicative DNA helicase [Candidatus Enteromonas sp.]|nr:replicative DNA helicase [Candidatus Enteromonas sp.]